MSKVLPISECYVLPNSELKTSERFHYLSPRALKLLSLGNTQYGVLFTASSSTCNNSLFDNLKTSLTNALVYFYPLAGRLVTIKHENEHSCSIFVDCTKGPGARLIHASALDVTVADIINPNTDVPLVVQSFFDLGERQVNHDGHTRALLSLQMTELVDGLFIGCCINHCIADGTSLSHFLNILSEIFTTKISSSLGVTHISRLPVFELPRSLSDKYQDIKLPYVEADEFVTRFHEGDLRDRIFHFSTTTMAKLKAKANSEANNNDRLVNLSSYKALCAHTWQAITRARSLSHDEVTTFVLTVNIRHRLSPPASPDYFANCFVVATATVKAGELLSNGLGWATMLIHQKVEAVNDKVAREALVVSGGKSVTVEPLRFATPGSNLVVMGGSPWFDLYKADFGLGKPVAVRTGYTNRGCGKLTAFPGRHGSGSVDLQVGLLPETMSALLLDKDFMG